MSCRCPPLRIDRRDGSILAQTSLLESGRIVRSGANDPAKTLGTEAHPPRRRLGPDSSHPPGCCPLFFRGALVAAAPDGLFGGDIHYSE